MNKKLILLPIVTLMVIMMAGLVNAVATFNISNGDTLAGIIQINVTTSDINATDGTSLNCSVTGSSAITGDSMSVLAENSSVNLGTNSTTNVTLDTAALMTDASDWIFSATCTNGTGSTESATQVTGIIIDNTNPGCQFAATLISNDVYAPTQTWSILSSNGTSATIQFGSNTARIMTKSGSMSAQTFEGVLTYTGDRKAVPQGSYKTLTVITSDGVDTTTCSLTSIRIDIGIPLKEIAAIVASGAKVTGAATTPTSNNSTILIIIFGLAAFWWYRNRKGN